MKERQDKALSLESIFTELESLIARLEGDELSMEQSLEAFRTGIGFCREAQRRLEDSEQSIRILLDDDGAATEKALESE